MQINISPHFTDEKLNDPSIDDLIDVFDDRIRFWTFEPVKTLLQVPTGNVAAFCLLLTYFEGIWSYITCQDSNRKSQQFFCEAFVDVFRHGGISVELLGRIGNLLYKDARCGFFHDSMFRERIFFAEMNHDILETLIKSSGYIDETGKIQSILIDPQRFFVAIENHFANFIRTLRAADQVQKRLSFLEFCRQKWNWEQEGPIIGIDKPSTLSEQKLV